MNTEQNAATALVPFHRPEADGNGEKSGSRACDFIYALWLGLVVFGTAAVLVIEAILSVFI